MASSLTVKGLIHTLENQANVNATGNVSYRKVNIQVDVRDGPGPNRGGFVTFSTFDATNASGIDALFVGSSCTLTVTSP